MITAEGAVIGTPDGPILHVERARPLVRISDFVRSRLIARPGYVTRSIEPIVTDEGEHAAIVTAEAPGAVIAWGLIFGDEHYAWYEGTTVEPIRMLARAHRLGLGPRWRQFRYAPPAGWDALARGLVTDWLQPGFPSRWGVMTVYPAFPASVATASVVPMLLANATALGFVAAGTPDICEVESSHGLSGVWADVTGTFEGVETRRAIAAFLDLRYVYPLEVQTRTDAWIEARDAFSVVCRSVEPVPSPTIPSYWAD